MSNVLLPEQFAEEVVSKLYDENADESWFLDRGDFALVLKDPLGRPLQTLRLASFYQTYKDHGALDKAIEQIVAMTNRSSDTSDYKKVAPSILPKIYDRAAIMTSMRKYKVDYGDKAPQFEIWPICDVFALMLVVDGETTQEIITTHHLIDWGKTMKEVFEDAYRNLERMSQDSQYVQLFDNKTNMAILYESTWQDAYDASRMVMDDLVDGFAVNGDVMLAAPVAGQFFIAGSDCLLGSVMLLQKLEEAKEQPKALPPYILVRKDGKWTHYAPPKDSGQFDMLKRLQTEYWIKAYAQQQELIHAQGVNPSEELFAASYKGVQLKDKRIVSYSTWSEGVPTLLPKTDFVSFMSGKDMVAQAAWEQVQSILKDSLVLHDPMDYPPRFRTIGFPTKQQLKQIGMQDF